MTDQPSFKSIQENIRTLNSRDVLDRQRAREDLLKAGPPALKSLLQALHDPDDQVRWEAVRVLREMKDPSIVPELIRMLRDENFVVRWMASEALVDLGHYSLIPVLRELIVHPDLGWLHDAAHHVLRLQAYGKLKPILSPVLKAMDSVECTLEVPIAATVAIRKLEELAHTFEWNE